MGAGFALVTGTGLAAGCSGFVGAGLGVLLKAGEAGATFGCALAVAPGFLVSKIFLAIALSRFRVMPLAGKGRDHNGPRGGRRSGI